MNWEIILYTLVGIITGSGSIAWIFKLREDKGKSEADAIETSASAMTKLLKNVEQQQETFNKIIKGKDKIIEQQLQVIENYKTALNEENKKLKEFEYKLAESERKIAGMQKMIDAAINDRRIAESMACYDEECNQRKTKKDN